MKLLESAVSVSVDLVVVQDFAVDLIASQALQQNQAGEQMMNLLDVLEGTLNLDVVQTFVVVVLKAENSSNDFLLVTKQWAAYKAQTTKSF